MFMKLEAANSANPTPITMRGAMHKPQHQRDQQELRRERERQLGVKPPWRLITAINVLTTPNPHSPYHASLLMQPGRNAGSIGWTPELRALEHAEMR